MSVLTERARTPRARQGEGVFDPDKWKRRVWRANVNSRDQKGWTPIQIAVFHDHCPIVKMLLEHGADPRFKNAYNKDAFELAKGKRPPNVQVRGRGRSAGRRLDETERLRDRERQ